MIWFFSKDSDFIAHSRSESLRVTREETGLADVVQIAIELYNTFETETGATMARSTILERINVILNRLNCDVLGFGLLFKQFRVVNTLGT